ncbi:tol-pal system protein YbgF, partial [Rhodoplanes elegans]
SADPSLARGPAAGGGALPAPPPRNPNATGAQMATLPPGGGPKDQYDLGYGYVLRKDYPLAEQTFRDFLRRYPGDRLALDAQYWLGESLFLQKNFREAADAFLVLTQKAGTNPKGADAFLRLGQSLAALNQKDMACASFAQVGARYPRASVNVKQAVEREQKRVHCL